MNAFSKLSMTDQSKARSAIKRINTQKKYLNKEYPGLTTTRDINDFFEKFPQTKSGNISTKGLDQSQLNAILYADKKAKFSIRKRKEEIKEALDEYDIGDIESKEDLYKADDILDKLNEYVEKTGMKKKFIAQSIGENPNNFSRWLTGKRNYSPEREQQIIDFLIERGMLNAENS